MKKRLLCGLLTFAMVLSMLIVVPATTVVAADTWSSTVSSSTPTITTDADMAEFAKAVTGGNTFAGKTVLLAGNVTLSTTVGGVTTVSPFSGNFDGRGYTVTINQSFTGTEKDGGGLFSKIRVPNGGTITIQNVHIAGTISIAPSGDNSADTHGGLISMLESGVSGDCTVNITNCWSSLRIEQTNSCAVARVGGIIGYISHDTRYMGPLTINMESCLWDGTIYYKNQSNKVGGFIGHTGGTRSGKYVTINISNSVSAGVFDLNDAWCADTGNVIGHLHGEDSGGKITVNVTNMLSYGYFKSSTGVTYASSRNYGHFNRNNNSLTELNLTNFYYYKWSDGGKTGKLVGNDSKNGTYTNVVEYTDGDTSFNSLTYSSFSSADQLKWLYTYNSKPIPSLIYGTFMASDGLHSHFTDSTASTYDIANPTDMMNFAKAVNNCALTFEGKTVRLTADINLSGQTWVSIGKRLANGFGTRFCGTFEGNWKQIQNLHSVTSTNAQGGFFGFLGGGAVVQNFWLTGDTGEDDSHFNIRITGGGDYHGGLADAITGTVTVNNVRNSLKIKARTNLDTIGGFVGFLDNGIWGSLTMDGCMFDGLIDTHNNVKYAGGFVGSTGNNNGQSKRLNITNCVYDGKIALRCGTEDAQDTYAAIAMFVGEVKYEGATDNTNVIVTIQNCLATGSLDFITDYYWKRSNLGECGQIIGKLYAVYTSYNGNVYTNPLTNVYYLPSTVSVDKTDASTKTLAVYGNYKGTYQKDDDNAKLCSAADLAALTASSFSDSSKWTNGSSSTTTLNYPKLKQINNHWSYTAQKIGANAQVTGITKSTTNYSGSLTFTATFYNTASCTNGGTADANFGVIVISKAKYLEVAKAGQVTVSSLTASGYGKRIYAIKYTDNSSNYTVKLALSNYTTYTAKQSTEYVVIPYYDYDSTPTLGESRFISYSAL